jgi:uncharacterized protein YfdQ (DUF2303 family)
MSQENTEAAAIAGLAAKPFIETIEGVPHLIHPTGDGAWAHVALPALLSAPVRKRGTVTIHEVDSFITFAKKQGNADNTNIYLDVDYSKQHIVSTAVFNDDFASEKAGWKDHRAVFIPRIGEEWRRWNTNDKKHMAQTELAQFLETNIADIVKPDGSKLPSGSDVLGFVSKLEETRTVKYGSGINLQNGMVQLEFTEAGDDHTKGKLELFREFAIGVRPFFGGQAYEVRAFLRYRIDRNSGQIMFWYELQRADRVLEDASKELIDKISKGTGFPVIFGAAPQASS